jgi:UPF0176 protein
MIGIESTDQIEIITFYEFKKLTGLDSIRSSLRDKMRRIGVRGTVLLAEEGFNSTVCGTRAAIREFVTATEAILETTLVFKSAYHNSMPHRKIDVKIRPEIVTLKRPVKIELGRGTHVDSKRWNEIISSNDTLILDTRNDYEYRNGTFRGAIDPAVKKFSELPDYVEENLDPQKHRNIAMFCTGGIRCEKFAPYMKQLGFENVYQLDGGILKYLKDTPAEDSLWEGECFVFDDRRTVDEYLRQGVGPDYSLDRDG